MGKRKFVQPRFMRVRGIVVTLQKKPYGLPFNINGKCSHRVDFNLNTRMESSVD